MKTVKRKAEVGETVKSLVTGRTGKVLREFENGTLEVFHESASYTGNLYMSPGRYEVIIGDEPKVTVDENGVTVEYPDGRRDEYNSECAKFYEPGEKEPKTIKFGDGPVVKDEESNAYISAADVDELKDEAMKRLLTPDQTREKLKLPHRVHPKPSSREQDATDYGGPLGTPIPPHSSHYHQNGLDPLEVMRRTFPPEQYEGFLRGNALKYTMRYDRKGQQQEDLEKLNFYGRELEEWKNALKDVDGKVIEAEGAE